jgi:hypothetical protein
LKKDGLHDSTKSLRGWRRGKRRKKELQTTGERKWKKLGMHRIEKGSKMSNRKQKHSCVD